MAKPPKVADVDTLGDFSHWLADTIQRAAAREDAGFVQIERRTESLLVVQTGRSVFRCAIAKGVDDAA